MKDIKEIMVERDIGNPFSCYNMDWKVFQADKPLKKDDDRLRVLTPRKRKAYVDKWRKTHDDIDGVSTYACVVEELGKTKQAEVKIKECAVQTASHLKIPSGRHRVDKLSVNDGEGNSNFPKCGLNPPDASASQLRSRIGKEKAEMEKAMKHEDPIGIKLHLDEMIRQQEKYNNLDKSMCYCGTVKFYTGKLFVDKWSEQNG